jgi:lactoylglutathione lyase
MTTTEQMRPLATDTLNIPRTLAQDLFEAHLPVADLDRAIEFYRDAVGLRLAHVTPSHEAAFFWIGPAGQAMLGLWKAGGGPQRVTLHTAFRASLSDVIAAPRTLRSAGITPLDFSSRPTDQPVVLAWMPAAAVYFRDPDGHLLEYIAMLPQEPRPDRGVMPWRMWELLCCPGSEKQPEAAGQVRLDARLGVE